MNRCSLIALGLCLAFETGLAPGAHAQQTAIPPSAPAQQVIAKVVAVYSGYQYITIDNSAGNLRLGARVNVGAQDGSWKEFRVDRLSQNLASAIPLTDLNGVIPGAAVIAATGNAPRYAQDRPLATREEVQSVRQDAERRSQEEGAAFLDALGGALTAAASGANPTIVNSNAQVYLAQQQQKIESGGNADPATPADLAARFSTSPLVQQNAATAAVSGPQLAQNGSPSYSQLSQADQQALAATLTDRVNRECRAVKDQAAAGSVRATYEAAACTYGIFYLGVPADYPNRESFKQEFYRNSALARQMGSSALYLAPNP